MKLKYCTNCVMPNTKPDLHFNDKGMCDACQSANKKDFDIDWDQRRKEFDEIIERYRSKDKSNYDCLIPVSGGKDSHYQTYIMKKVCGLRPLCICFEPTFQTPRGKRNLDNLGKLGVDTLYIKKDPLVYKKMVLEGFRRVGDSEWPNHLAIFTMTIRYAVALNIPLLIWGENSQLEYGGPAGARDKNILDRRWLEEFGGLLGNRVEDMIGVDGLTRDDLLEYVYPLDPELKRVGVTGLFLGHYFKWDQRRQVEKMKEYGFEVRDDGPIEGTYTNYENLDDHTVGLHDYLKFVKYGFGRATDHACMDIRNKRISREEGLRLINMYDGKYPYYGVKMFSEYSGMNKEEIDNIIDQFTNKLIFKTNEKGNFIKDIAGNLVMRYERK